MSAFDCVNCGGALVCYVTIPRDGRIEEHFRCEACDSRGVVLTGGGRPEKRLGPAFHGGIIRFARASDLRADGGDEAAAPVWERHRPTPTRSRCGECGAMVTQSVSMGEVGHQPDCSRHRKHRGGRA